MFALFILTISCKQNATDGGTTPTPAGSDHPDISGKWVYIYDDADPHGNKSYCIFTVTNTTFDIANYGMSITPYDPSDYWRTFYFVGSWDDKTFMGHLDHTSKANSWKQYIEMTFAGTTFSGFEVDTSEFTASISRLKISGYKL